jgi:hypothetical protein
MHTRAVTVLLAVLPSLSLGAPSDLAAQRCRQVALEVRAGWVGPTTDLGRTAILEGLGFVEFEEPPSTWSTGLGIVVDWAEAWSTRLTVDRAAASDVGGQWFCAPGLACPSVLILVGAELDRWTVGADMLYRPALPNPIATPEVFIGAGVRHHRLRWDSPIPEVPIPTEFDETDMVVRMGLGASRGLGPVALVGQLQGDLGGFGSAEERLGEHRVPDGRVLNVDLAAGLGVRIRLR